MRCAGAQHLLLFGQGHKVNAHTDSEHSSNFVKRISEASVTHEQTRGGLLHVGLRPLLEDEHIEQQGSWQVTSAEHLVDWDRNVEGVSTRS